MGKICLAKNNTTAPVSWIFLCLTLNLNYVIWILPEGWEDRDSLSDQGNPLHQGQDPENETGNLGKMGLILLFKSAGRDVAISIAKTVLICATCCVAENYFWQDLDRILVISFCKKKYAPVTSPVLKL